MSVPIVMRMRSRYLQLAGCENGGVLMEYVLVTVFIVCPLVWGFSRIFDPAGALDGDFGFLGNSFVDMFRLIMSGMGLPLP